MLTTRDKLLILRNFLETLFNDVNPYYLESRKNKPLLIPSGLMDPMCWIPLVQMCLNPWDSHWTVKLFGLLNSLPLESEKPIPSSDLAVVQVFMSEEAWHEEINFTQRTLGLSYPESFVMLIQDLLDCGLKDN
jgi:hypothetical protein